MNNLEFINGLKFFQKGKFHQAIDAFMKSIEKNPNNADSYNHIGLSYDCLSEHSLAIENYEKATNICIEFNDLNSAGKMKVHKADSMIKISLFNEAELLIDEILDSNVNLIVKAQAFSILITSLILQGKYNEALKKLDADGLPYLVYFQDINDNFGLGIISMLRARLYTYILDYDSAILSFESARYLLKGKKSSIAELDNNYGEFLLLENNPKDALRYFKKSWKYFKKYNPSYSINVIKNLSEAYRKIGDEKKTDYWMKLLNEI
ncbi:MAG: tetratricopeptide repeat protein [bacterium]